MSEKITTIAAVENIEKLIIDLQLALDSAERFHQVVRQQTAAPNPAESSEGEEIFSRQRVQKSSQTPEEHDIRIGHCKHNRECINKLNATAQHILNAYQDDLKEHHHIDEGARLLEISQAIDDILAEGHWQQGLFFRTIGEKLKTVREIFHDSAMLWRARVQTKEEAAKGAAPTGAKMHTVYVSVYQAGGQSIQNWNYMISHIAEHTMGRPAYMKREDVEGFVRSRPVPSNEAYLVADVLERDIVDGMGKGTERKDSSGRSLLSLSKGSIKLENIHEFVHGSGSYRIGDGGLKLIQSDK